MRMATSAAVLGAMVALSGCASFFDNAWEDAANDACNEETTAQDRLDCRDRVDSYSRERERERDSQD